MKQKTYVIYQEWYDDHWIWVAHNKGVEQSLFGTAHGIVGLVRSDVSADDCEDKLRRYLRNTQTAPVPVRTVTI